MSKIYQFSSFEDANAYASQLNNKDIIIYTKPRESMNSTTYMMWHVEVIGQTNNLGSGAYIEVNNGPYGNLPYQLNQYYTNLLNGGLEYNDHPIQYSYSYAAFDTMYDNAASFDNSDFRSFLASNQNTHNIYTYTVM